MSPSITRASGAGNFIQFMIINSGAFFVCLSKKIYLSMSLSLFYCCKRALYTTLLVFKKVVIKLHRDLPQLQKFSKKILSRDEFWWQEAERLITERETWRQAFETKQKMRMQSFEDKLAKDTVRPELF